MKKIGLIFIIFLFTVFIISCSDSDDASPVETSTTDTHMDTQVIQDAIDSYPNQAVSQFEEEGLLFMREEEKLARDVYRYLYEKYQTKIFNNIANSESIHMEAVKMLLDKYGFIDPVVDDAIGVFQNEALAALYTQLISAGDVSLVEALKVGATIEDLDIRDLVAFENEVDNKDIVYVYENLTKGSRNHLRAFYPKVLDNGGTYEAQFITQELFDEIINSPKETGSW